MLRTFKSSIETSWFLLFRTMLARTLLLTLFFSSDALPLCPHPCQCDGGKYVSCQGDRIQGLPPGLTDASPQRLQLKGFENLSMSSDLKPFGKGLRDLRATECGLKKLDLAPFPDLESLDVTGNDIESIEGKDWGQSPPHLLSLVVKDNHIASIEDSALECLGGFLEHLDLSGNNLEHLTTKTFSGLTRLQILNLDRNDLKVIESGSFQDLHDLNRLSLSVNPLYDLPRLDLFGPRLRGVDLSSTHLERIPQSLSRSVTELRLPGNRLKRVSAGDLDSYPMLSMLVLDDNSLEDIEDDALGRLEDLSRLWLNNNLLSRVPAGLPANLNILYMEQNHLEGLTKSAFGQLTSLQQLFLQRNHIQEVSPCAFCGLDDLRNLDLSRNWIRVLRSGVFSNLTRLLTLDLSQNPLVSIDSGSFDGLPHLVSLHLSRVLSPLETWNGTSEVIARAGDESILDPALLEPNASRHDDGPETSYQNESQPEEFRISETVLENLESLRTLEMNDSPELARAVLSSTRLLHALRGLRELSAERCELHSLREDFPSFLPSLRRLRLGGNGWHCDARLRWLSQWLRRGAADDLRVEGDVRCATPPQLEQRPLADLTELDFEIRPRSTLVVRLNMLVPATTTTSEWFDPPTEQPKATDSERFMSELSPQTSSSTNPVEDTSFAENPQTFKWESSTHMGSHTSPLPEDSSSQLSTEGVSAPRTVSLTTVPSNQRVSSPPTNHIQASARVSSHGGDFATPSGVLPLLLGGIAVGVAGLVGMAVWRRRLSHSTRRRSVVTYHPQGDEMSIVTMAEDRLYYIRENEELLSDNSSSQMY